ncbi:MAG: FAD:protein FMN transferase [Pseudomonadales bacterium]
MRRQAGAIGAAVLLLAGLVGGCDRGSDFRRYGGSTMGTYYQVTARCPDDVSATIEDTLHQVNGEMSTYLPDSALSRFNSAPVNEWFPVPRELIEVVSAAESLSRQSDGAFDVTVGPLVNLWGFGPDATDGVPSDLAVSDTLARVGHRYLAVRAEPPALRKTVELYVDLSAIAKGHGVDRVARRLGEAGCDAMLVDIGGEVRGSGPSPMETPWRIGIEVPDPESVGAVQRVVRIDNSAVATSGDYRNFREADGRRFSHTIDPRTGYPVQHALASVSVVHESAMWADGYATLLNVLGPEQGLAFAREHDLAALFVIRRDSGFEERYTQPFEALLLD